MMLFNLSRIPNVRDYYLWAIESLIQHPHLQRDQSPSLHCGLSVDSECWFFTLNHTASRFDIGILFLGFSMLKESRRIGCVCFIHDVWVYEMITTSVRSD